MAKQLKAEDSVAESSAFSYPEEQQTIADIRKVLPNRAQFRFIQTFHGSLFSLDDEIINQNVVANFVNPEKSSTFIPKNTPHLFLNLGVMKGFTLKTSVCVVLLPTVFAGYPNDDAYGAGSCLRSPSMVMFGYRRIFMGSDILAFEKQMKRYLTHPRRLNSPCINL